MTLFQAKDVSDENEDDSEEFCKENDNLVCSQVHFISDGTDLAFMLCVFYAEPRISRVAISSGRARAISRNPVHTLKAKSIQQSF